MQQCSLALEHWTTAAHPASPMPRWIAHRGGGTIAPENTLEAFTCGYDYGFRAFECDVQCSSDGVCVLMHDQTLKRTTNSSGLLQHAPWAELQTLDAGAWYSPAFAGACIPRLEALLEWVSAHQVTLNLEIKPTPAPACTIDLAQAVASTLHQWLQRHPNQSTTRLLISSSSADALQCLHDHIPTVARAFLTETLGPTQWSMARALQCQGLSARYQAWTPEYIERAHAQGLACAAYTVNTQDVAKRLFSMGIDSCFTDNLVSFAPPK